MKYLLLIFFALCAVGQVFAAVAYQPSAPYYGAFFYNWFKNPATDGAGQWGIWADADASGSHVPPSNWYSHYLPELTPGAFDSSKSLYSSNDYNIFKWQVGKLMEAKQTVAIASWWGQGDRSDSAFSKDITDFMNRSDNPYPNLRWAIYYECEGGTCNGTTNPSVAQLVSDLNYIAAKYTSQPGYLRVNGKPVIFAYADNSDGGGTDSSCNDNSMTARWSKANALAATHFYVNLKVFVGSTGVPCQPDSWHQYAPAVRAVQQGSFSYSISPAFWLTGAVERLPRDINAFTSAVQGMVAANATWKLVTTWNEWGEGSSVEPGVRVTQANGSSVSSPDTSAPAFGNAFIDALHANLPALNSVTTTPIPTNTPTLFPTPTLASPTGGPTRTPTATPTTASGSPVPVPGDANGDRKVDEVDYGIMVSHIGQISTGATSGDFNGNGIVDGLDYVIWLMHFGTNVTTTAPTSTPTPTRTPTPTPASSGSDPVVVAAGDIICDSLATTSTACRQMTVSQVAVNAHPNAVLILGDLCHTPSANCFSNYYAPSWGRLFSITHPATGNHEYLVAGASFYFDYWNGTGNATGPAGNRSQGYYSFDIGKWHIIALNSQCSEAGGCNTGSPQYTWLQNDLAAHPNACTLAYYHIPIYSVGGQASANAQAMYALMYQKGVEIVLNGHDHVYQRFVPQDANGNAVAGGITEFVVGTGGANHTAIVSTNPHLVTANADTFGVLKLTLHPTGADFVFLPDTTSGTFTDSGSISCH